MTEHHGPADREVERAIIARLLSRHYERASLQVALEHIEPPGLEAALERLQQHGVVDALTAESISLSSATQHLDDLGLIGI
ncbi:MAG: hypothetical protein ACYDHN_08200 [Solirubrobacteraceae bacterium]